MLKVSSSFESPALTIAEEFTVTLVAALHPEPATISTYPPLITTFPTTAFSQLVILTTPPETLTESH